jgi:hypothetical protein
MKRFALFLVLALIAVNARSQTASFVVTYNGFTPQAQAAFNRATEMWSTILMSDVPIKINAHFIPMLPGMLGITFPNGRKNFSGAPLPATWYATSLANSIAGMELNSGESDLDVFLNASASWYFDSTGAVPAGQYDFASVAMHEIGHGLGFVSLAKKEGAVGSFGLLEAADFAPLVPSFPWPDLDSLPGAFDRFLVNAADVPLLSLPNPSNALGSALTNNNVYFNGTHAMTANGGAKPRVYAPGSFELGSSISHFNETTYPVGNANEMMTPNGEPGHRNMDPGPVAYGVLRDIGWNLNPAVSTHEITSTQNLRVFPNPVQNIMVITNAVVNERSTLRCIDVMGRVHTVLGENGLVDVSALPSGYYMLMVENETGPHHASFVKP